MNATVLGSRGFIGSHCVTHLKQLGVNVFAPRRDDPSIFSNDLGHVFYCAGLTADFRQQPVATIKAHVSSLVDVLEQAKYESLLSLSSTRVYTGSTCAREEETLRVNPGDPSDLYNLSKLTGEAACLAFKKKNVRVGRLSNVYGIGMDSVNFLGSLVNDAVTRGRISLATSRAGAKDYVCGSDVVKILSKIAFSGRHSLYNIASGRNVSTDQIVNELARLTGCTIEVAENAPTLVFPEIQTDRIREEFAFTPRTLIPML